MAELAPKIKKADAVIERYIEHHNHMKRKSLKNFKKGAIATTVGLGVLGAYLGRKKKEEK